MVTGGTYREYNKIKIVNKDILDLKGLIDHRLKKETKPTFDEYIIATFQAFTRHKKQIVLDLYYLDNFANQRMRDLIINKLDGRHSNEESKREDKDFTNLPRSEMFDIFNNVKTLILKTTVPYGHSYSYSSNLSALLSSIHSSSLNRVIIKAQSDPDGNNWIRSFWRSYSEKTRKESAEKHYNITVKEEKQEYQFIIDEM